jgi:hypothetical protein
VRLVERPDPAGERLQRAFQRLLQAGADKTKAES